MTERSRSLLFLMEQLFVIVVFAVCAAVCVKIFVASYQTARATNDLNNAMLVAASGAEACKASEGPEQAAEFLNGVHTVGGVKVFYNEFWNVCGENEAGYVMSLNYRPPEETGASLIYGDITVDKASGENIIAITAAVRRGGYE